MIICFGELLIDMISQDIGSLVSSSGFLKKFGGAPANTAMGLARLGVKVGFMGKVGNDPFGLFLKQTLEENNVDTKNLILSSRDKTTLAFVSLTKTGERDFVFYKGAHDTITPEEVNLPNNTAIFHFGSLTQITAGSRQATQKLISQARSRRLILSYDPNIREALWGDLKKAKKIISDTVKKVDVVKVNEIEAKLLTKQDDPLKAAGILFQKNLDALFITLGEHGCYFKTKITQGKVSTIKVKTIDTTGAGDAFNAGFLHTIYSTNKRFSDMEQKELENHLKRALIIATLTTTKKGAITAFPKEGEIKKYL